MEKEEKICACLFNAMEVDLTYLSYFPVKITETFQVTSR